MTPAELDVVGLSLRVAALAVGVSLVPGVVVGWVLARWEHPVRALIQGIVMLPIVMPPVATGYILLYVLGRHRPLGRMWQSMTGEPIAFTTTACVVAAAVVGFPLLVESIRLSMSGVDRRLERASRTLGRGRLDTFVRITLPLARPGIVAGMVLAFARALGEFGATIVLAGNIPGETRTIPVAVYTLLNTTDGEAAAVRLVVVSVALSLLALFVSFWATSRPRETR